MRNTVNFMVWAILFIIVMACNDEQAIQGCTNPDSFNYDPMATQNDGSCSMVPISIIGEYYGVYGNDMPDQLIIYNDSISWGTRNSHSPTDCPEGWKWVTVDIIRSDSNKVYVDGTSYRPESNIPCMGLLIKDENSIYSDYLYGLIESEYEGDFLFSGWMTVFGHANTWTKTQ